MQSRFQILPFFIEGGSFIHPDPLFLLPLQFLFDGIGFIFSLLLSFFTADCQLSSWNHSNGYCYLYKSHTDRWKRDWKSAFETCHAKNANLLVIDDFTEQEAIKKSLRQGAYWIGYSRADTKSFKDIFGRRLPQFPNWAPNEPDDHNSNERCLALVGNERGKAHGAWKDDNCQNKMGFICKMKGKV